MAKYQVNIEAPETEALAVTISASDSLRRAAENVGATDRIMLDGDKLIIEAGLPFVKKGEINGESREWLAFPAKIVRKGKNIATTISLSSLTRGYFAEEEDKVLATSERTGNTYPSRDLLKRYGNVSVDTVLVKGTEIPFISDEVTVTLKKVHGYRPVYTDGNWSTEEGDLIVVL